MTEAEWLNSDDPQRMLEWLLGWWSDRQVKINDRKLRLFACASARLPWPVDSTLDDTELQVIDAAECMADDSYHLADLDDYERVARWANKTGVIVLIERNGEYAARQWCRFGGRSPAFQRQQASLLRDIVGNSFRPVQLPGLLDSPSSRGEGLPTVQRAFCPWITPTVLDVAAAIYLSRDWAALPILADALEDAGCESEALLRHLRGEEEYLSFSSVGGQGAEDIPPDRLWRSMRGPHTLGCWALDLILNKE